MCRIIPGLLESVTKWLTRPGHYPSTKRLSGKRSRNETNLPAKNTRTRTAKAGISEQYINSYSQTGGKPKSLTKSIVTTNDINIMNMVLQIAWHYSWNELNISRFLLFHVSFLFVFSENSVQVCIHFSSIVSNEEIKSRAVKWLALGDKCAAVELKVWYSFQDLVLWKSLSLPLIEAPARRARRMFLRSTFVEPIHHQLTVK